MSYPNQVKITGTLNPNIDGVVLSYLGEFQGGPAYGFNFSFDHSFPEPTAYPACLLFYNTTEYLLQYGISDTSQLDIYIWKNELAGPLVLPAIFGAQDGTEYDPDCGTPTGTATVDVYVSAPAITLAAGTDSLTVTIAGDAGVTNTVLYKLASGEWAVGGSRTGDGDVAISGLVAGVYQVLAYSSYTGHNSPPSNLAEAVVTPLSLSAWLAANRLTLTAAQLAAADLILEFGQAVTYQPASGSPRNIYAIVDHNGVKRLDAAPQGHGPVMTVSVFNHSSYGITPAEVDTGKDTIVIPNRVGSAVKVRRLSRIVSQDEGIVQFEAR